MPPVEREACVIVLYAGSAHTHTRDEHELGQSIWRLHFFSLSLFPSLHISALTRRCTAASYHIRKQEAEKKEENNREATNVMD